MPNHLRIQKISASRTGFLERSHKNKGEICRNLTGTLTAKDHEQAHERKVTAGNTYAIDMESSEFDTFLRLENAKKSPSRK
jgi:hypothetical protein